MARELTRKQQIFVLEYIKDENGARSAVAAGYATNGAEVTASRLLTNAKVLAEIEKKRERILTKLEITTEKVLQEIALLGFANMLDYMRTTEGGDAYVDFSKLTREQAAAIQEITVDEYTEGRGEEKRNVKRTKFKLADKRGSLELLGRHLKMFTDKLETKDTSDKPVAERLEALLARLAQKANRGRE